MKEPTQTELYQELTVLIHRFGGKIPEYWKQHLLVGFMNAGKPAREHLSEGEALVSNEWLEPSPSQLLELIEMEGYRYNLEFDGGGYACYALLRKKRRMFESIWTIGRTLDEALTLAAIEVLERKEEHNER